jgi:hypothetical protein
MKHLLLNAAVFCAVVAHCHAQNLGKDLLTRTYPSKKLDTSDCSASLAAQLFNVNDDPSDPTLKPTVEFPCANSGAYAGEILIHGTVWRIDDTPKTLSAISSEWRVYRGTVTKGKDQVRLREEGVRQPAKKKDEAPENAGKKSDNAVKPSFWPRRPPLYGKSVVPFIGVTCFVNPDNTVNSSIADKLDTSYNVSVQPATPENMSNLSAVVSALLGGAAGGNKAALAQPFCDGGRVTFGKIKADHPPYDIQAKLSVAFKADDKQTDNADKFALAPAPAAGFRNARPLLASLGASIIPPSSQQGGGGRGAGGGGNAGNNAGNNNGGGNGGGNNSGDSGGGDCSAVTAKAGCSMTHTIHALDREYWDLSMGIAIPGVREPQYSASDLTQPPTATRHTDVYGFVDLFLAAKYASKTSPVPHIALGIPVAGKPFYRPFFGLGENITGWSRSFPFQVSFVAGPVLLNQEVVRKNAAGALTIQHSRVVKMMYGIEVPVGNLISKITALGGGGKSSNSATGGNSGGSGSKKTQ